MGLANFFSTDLDLKSTRLNSSHDQISYAVFCLKKKRKYGQGGVAEEARSGIEHWRHGPRSGLCKVWSRGRPMGGYGPYPVAPRVACVHATSQRRLRARDHRRAPRRPAVDAESLFGARSPLTERSAALPGLVSGRPGLCFPFNTTPAAQPHLLAPPPPLPLFFRGAPAGRPRRP